MGVSMLTWKLRTASLFGQFPRREKRKRRPRESLVLINVEMDGGGAHYVNGLSNMDTGAESNQLYNCGRSLRKKKAPATRIFSPLAVARLFVAIGHYWYLFKGLTALPARRFYRFEHIVSYSSGKVVAKSVHPARAKT